MKDRENVANVDRRRFLRAVGATALTYPFLRGVPGYAATTAPPRYLVLLFSPTGVVRHLWGAPGTKPVSTTPGTCRSARSVALGSESGATARS